MKHVTHLTREEMIHSLDGELTPGDRARIEIHLASCDDCLGRYEDLSEFSETLNHAIETAPVSAPASARQRLQTAIEAPAVVSPVRPIGLWKWLAVAAAIVGFFLLIRQRPAPPQQNTVANVMRTQAAPREKVEPPQAAPGERTDRGQALTSSARSPRAMGAFTRLPYSDPSLPLDSADVIRVQMRLSSLANVGLVHADPEGGDPLVDADVLLGLDGQPSAIRLLQPGSNN